MDQSEPGSDDNEGVLYIPQSSTTSASLSDGFVSYLGHLVGGLGVLPLCRDVVGIFLKLWGIMSTSSWPLLPSPHGLRVVVYVRVPSIGQIE